MISIPNAPKGYSAWVACYPTKFGFWFILPACLLLPLIVVFLFFRRFYFSLTRWVLLDGASYRCEQCRDCRYLITHAADVYDCVGGFAGRAAYSVAANGLAVKAGASVGSCQHD